MIYILIFLAQSHLLTQSYRSETICSITTELQMFHRYHTMFMNNSIVLIPIMYLLVLKKCVPMHCITQLCLESVIRCNSTCTLPSINKQTIDVEIISPYLHLSPLMPQMIHHYPTMIYNSCVWIVVMICIPMQTTLHRCNWRINRILM